MTDDAAIDVTAHADSQDAELPVSAVVTDIPTQSVPLPRRADSSESLRIYAAQKSEITPELWGRAMSSVVVNGMVISKLARVYGAASALYCTSGLYVNADGADALLCGVDLGIYGIVVPYVDGGNVRWAILEHASLLENTVNTLALPGRSLADALENLLEDVRG